MPTGRFFLKSQPLFTRLELARKTSFFNKVILVVLEVASVHRDDLTSWFRDMVTAVVIGV